MLGTKLSWRSLRPLLRDAARSTEGCTSGKNPRSPASVRLEDLKLNMPVDSALFLLYPHASLQSSVKLVGIEAKLKLLTSTRHSSQNAIGKGFHTTYEYHRCHHHHPSPRREFAASFPFGVLRPRLASTEETAPSFHQNCYG